jgi:hypothetical protein
MPEFASEMHVERGGAGGRALGYYLQAAADLARFLERQIERRKGSSSACSKRARAKVSRQSSKEETGSRKKPAAA